MQTQMKKLEEHKNDVYSRANATASVSDVWLNEPVQMLKHPGVMQYMRGGGPEHSINRTGLPDNLKSGMEKLTGFNLDPVQVYRNSAKPAAFGAHAYAQGRDIHLASGQERQLPHELGHIVQQMRGDVKPTRQFAGVGINDDVMLEREADDLGSKALRLPLQLKYDKASRDTQPGFVSLRTRPNVYTKQFQCKSCLDDDPEKPLHPIQKARDERNSELNTIVGDTHLVQLQGGSLLKSKKVDYVRHGTAVTVNLKSKKLSRRGPNQEEFNSEDAERNTHIYTWYELAEQGGYYIREDTLSEHSREAITEATTELNTVQYFDDIIKANKKSPVVRMLRIEAVAHFTGGIIRMAAGISLATVGAIHALIGQFVSGVSAIAIGALKWWRADVAGVIGSTMDEIVDVSTKMRNYVVRGERGADTLNLEEGNKKLGELEPRLTKNKKTTNYIRVGESVVGTITTVANCLSGVFVACLGIVPNLLKAIRSISQLRRWLTNPRTIGTIIRVEALLSGLLAIFSIEDAARKYVGKYVGKDIEELTIVGDKSEDLGNEVKDESKVFDNKFYNIDEDSHTLDNKSNTVKDYSVGVSAIGAGFAGGVGAIAKYERGQNTPAAMKGLEAKSDKKEARKKQVKTAKRIRKESGDIQKSVKN